MTTEQKIAVLAQAATTLMDANKALTDRLDALESKKEEGGGSEGSTTPATEAEMDAVMAHVKI